MPPLNGRHTLSFTPYDEPSRITWTVQVMHYYVARQWHWDETLDFTPPPQAYHLFEAKVQLTLNRWKNKPELRLGVQNLFNSSYRDYLNRMRYFSDEMGRNITLSWVQNF
jgi:iron complex outermembrane receptor protein